MDLKRKVSDGTVAIPIKKTKNELAIRYGVKNDLDDSGIKRTSNLQAPIMLLSGHDGDIFCTKFAPSGRFLASAGFDRQIFLWSTYGDCDNIAVLKGHTGAIMDLHFSTDGSQIMTCATDKMCSLWDVEVGARLRKYRGHQTFVNACDIARRGPQLLCSGSDDGTIRIWDSRRKISIQSLQNMYQVTSVCFTDTAEQVVSGGIDNDLKVWDLRKNEVIYTMHGHSDTVTGMELSPDGSYLLTTAMDNTVRIWDVRPFAPQERCVKIFQGNQHTFEKNLLRVAWSPDGGKVSAGSGDRFVYIWDTTSRRILYKLPGHAGSVNEVDFHPFEPIVASGSSDKRIYLGEIE
jgi:Prp8 binding protein